MTTATATKTTLKQYRVWRYECPLYGEGKYNGFAEVKAVNARHAAEIVRGFDEEDGDMAVYDYQVELLGNDGCAVKDCGTF